MRRDRTQERLAGLAALDDADPDDPELRREVLRAAGQKNNLVVAKAAALIARHRLVDGVPLLREAFRCFVAEGTRRDPQCRAKLAIVEAFYELGVDDLQLFRAGLACVQREPVFGGTRDTAAELRGRAAVALARAGDQEVHFELVPVLADPEVEARKLAAVALALAGGDRSELVLRFHLARGEDDPEVLGECCAALLRLEPERSLPVVANLLASPDDGVVTEAALALADARHPRAGGLLRAAYADRLTPERRAALVPALALLRDEAAVAFLADIIAEGPLPEASCAAHAAVLHRVDARRFAVWLDAAQRRGEAELLEILGDPS